MLFSVSEHPVLLKRNAKCKSTIQVLATGLNYVKECAELCKNKDGCQFFMFGNKNTKKGECSWARTAYGDCQEGWQEDEYDFYGLKGIFDQKNYPFDTLRLKIKIIFL